VIQRTHYIFVVSYDEIPEKAFETEHEAREYVNRECADRYYLVKEYDRFCVDMIPLEDEA
jgi:hypothetical protein